MAEEGIITIYEAPTKDIGEHLIAFISQYGEILGASCDSLNEGGVSKYY